MRRALVPFLGVSAMLACGARTNPGDLFDEPTAPTGDGGTSASSSGGTGNLFGDAEVRPSPESGTTPPRSCPGIPPPGHGGAGTPEVLATLGAPASIAVDADALYVASYHAGPVSRVALDGSGAVTLDAVGSYNVAINSTTVFTPSIFGVVAACPKGGCGGNFATIASGQTGVWGVAADESTVYFTTASNGSPGGIRSVSVAGGAITELSQNAGTWLALYDGHLYTGLESLVRMDVDGSHVLTLASWPPESGFSLASVTVDCANVYYGGSDGTLASVPVLGGSVTTLATDQQTSLQLAVDQRDLYFTASTAAVTPGEKPTGFLRTVPIAGGTVRTLATFAGAPGGVAVDATYVYWANSDDGTVSRMTK